MHVVCMHGIPKLKKACMTGQAPFYSLRERDSRPQAHLTSLPVERRDSLPSLGSCGRHCDTPRAIGVAQFCRKGQRAGAEAPSRFSRAPQVARATPLYLLHCYCSTFQRFCQVFFEEIFSLSYRPPFQGLGLRFRR